MILSHCERGWGLSPEFYNYTLFYRDVGATLGRLTNYVSPILKVEVGSTKWSGSATVSPPSVCYLRGCCVYVFECISLSACSLKSERYRKKKNKLVFLSPLCGPWEEGPWPPRGGVWLYLFVYSMYQFLVWFLKLFVVYVFGYWLCLKIMIAYVGVNGVDELVI